MPTPTAAELFRHLSAEKSAFYRCILNVFAAAKRQYRLKLRPGAVPHIEKVNAALAQLAPTMHRHGLAIAQEAVVARLLLDLCVPLRALAR